MAQFDLDWWTEAERSMRSFGEGHAGSANTGLMRLIVWASQQKAIAPDAAYTLADWYDREREEVSTDGSRITGSTRH